MLLRRLSNAKKDEGGEEAPKRATFSNKVASVFFSKPSGSAGSGHPPLPPSSSASSLGSFRKESDPRAGEEGDLSAGPPPPRRKSVAFKPPQVAATDDAGLDVVLRARSRSIKDKDGVRVNLAWESN